MGAYPERADRNCYKNNRNMIVIIPVIRYNLVIEIIYRKKMGRNVCG